MFDLETFFSMYLAMVAAFGTMEVFTLGLKWHFSKKQKQEREEFESNFAKALSEGKFPPNFNPMGMLVGPDGRPVPMGTPITVSGSFTSPDANDEAFGTYV